MLEYCFRAVSEEIPLQTDPVKLLPPADHVEPCAVGVTDLDELSELGTLAGKLEDNVRPQEPGGGGGGCNTDRSPRWCGQEPHPCQPGWCHK